MNTPVQASSRSQAKKAATKRSQPHLTTVKVADLRIDLAYQREPSAAWVEAHRPFDPDKAGAIKVSARANGLWIVDGGGRWSIAKADGVETMAAFVMVDKGQKEEADQFVGAQQDSRRLTAFDLWRADLVRGEPSVMRIQTVIDRMRFKAGPTHQQGPNTISALVALRSIEKHWGIDILADTLRLVRERWLTLEKALTGQTLKGLAGFLVLARQDPKYDEERLEDVMLRYAPLTILQKAQELAINESSGNAQVRHISLAIADKYNQRLSPQRKIVLKTKRGQGVA